MGFVSFKKIVIITIGINFTLKAIYEQFYYEENYSSLRKWFFAEVKVTIIYILNCIQRDRMRET